jgi:hypothetical protein
MDSVSSFAVPAPSSTSWEHTLQQGVSTTTSTPWPPLPTTDPATHVHLGALQCVSHVSELSIWVSSSSSVQDMLWYR